VALLVALASCNAMFGVDDMHYAADSAVASAVSSSSGSGGSSSTSTTTTTASSAGSGGAVVASGAGGAGGAGGSLLQQKTLDELVYATDTTDGSGVSGVIDETVPSGSLVLALVAGRGTGPIAVSDGAGHSWSKVVEQVNGSNTEVVAVFHTLANGQLGNDNTVTADLGSAAPRLRSLLVLEAQGTSVFRDAVSAQNAGASLSATGSVAVANADSLILALTATGNTTPATYSTASDHTELRSFSTSFSSGAYFRIDATGFVGGKPVFSATNSNTNGESASAIVLFE
jgi:hypothetical protein